MKKPYRKAFRKAKTLFILLIIVSVVFTITEYYFGFEIALRNAIIYLVAKELLRK